MKTLPKSLALVIGFIVAIQVFGQGSAQNITQKIDRTDADTAFSVKNYKISIREYKKIVDKYPKDAYSWYRLGYSYLVLRRLDEGIDAFSKTILFKFQYPGSHYNLACAYALNGNKEKALDHFEKSIRAGYRRIEDIQADGDLKSLHDEPRYKLILEQAGDPLAFTPGATLIAGLQGYWDAQGGGIKGGLSWNYGSTRYAQNIDLVMGTKRVLFLMLSYKGDPNAWFASGSDSFGNRYFGKADVSSDRLTIEGGRLSVRSKIEIVPKSQSQAEVTHYEMEGGKWAAKQTYVLTAHVKPNGGR